MPKVSIIIPSYNHAPFLRQRINSILQQSFQDFELLILDDCSKDNSHDIIEEYRHHPQVSHIVFSETNSGSTFKQWEKGIGLATGEYIWIAESDDHCEATLLETLVNGIAGNARCTVAYCQSYSIDTDNRILHISQVAQLEQHMSGMDFIHTYLLYHSVIYNASMTIFRRDTYFAISKDYTAFRFCGDWVFWAEMVSRGDVFISGKVLNYFRFHANDVSSRMYKSGNSYIEQFRCLLLMKQKFSIGDKEYRKALSYYTTKYFVEKRLFSPEVTKEADALLNNNENRKFRWYLRRKWLQNRTGRVLQKADGWLNPQSETGQSF